MNCAIELRNARFCLTGAARSGTFAAMTTRTSPKKPAPQDWHPADIVAALRKAGWSSRSLARHHGYHPSALAKAMHRPYPRAERLIAQAIGVPPETIWPARYAERGKDSTRRGANPRRQEAA